MKRLSLSLLAALACAGSYYAGHHAGAGELAAYREELDFLNNLTPAQLLAEIDDTAPEEINRAVLARMDARELLGAGLDALSDEGADEDDIAAVLADVREGKGVER